MKIQFYKFFDTIFVLTGHMFRRLRFENVAEIFYEMSDVCIVKEFGAMIEREVRKNKKD